MPRKSNVIIIMIHFCYHFIKGDRKRKLKAAGKNKLLIIFIHFDFYHISFIVSNLNQPNCEVVEFLTKQLSEVTSLANS